MTSGITVQISLKFSAETNLILSPSIEKLNTGAVCTWFLPFFKYLSCLNKPKISELNNILLLLFA